VQYFDDVAVGIDVGGDQKGLAEVAAADLRNQGVGMVLCFFEVGRVHDLAVKDLNKYNYTLTVRMVTNIERDFIQEAAHIKKEDKGIADKWKIA